MNVEWAGHAFELTRAGLHDAAYYGGLAVGGLWWVGGLVGGGGSEASGGEDEARGGGKEGRERERERLERANRDARRAQERERLSSERQRSGQGEELHFSPATSTPAVMQSHVREAQAEGELYSGMMPPPRRQSA